MVDKYGTLNNGELNIPSTLIPSDVLVIYYIIYYEKIGRN